jgi:hypothetical protein
MVRNQTLFPTPPAVVMLLCLLLLPPLQLQLRQRMERRWLDLYTMHGNKRLQCKKLPERDAKCRNTYSQSETM